jgi:hypothetical protein
VDRAVVDRVVVGLVDRVLVVTVPGAVRAEAGAVGMDRAGAVAGKSRALEARGSGSSRS